MINVSRRTLIITLTALCIVWVAWLGVGFYQRHSGKSDFKELEITNEVDLKLDAHVANIYISPSDTNTLKIESKRAGLIDLQNQKDTINITVDDDKSRAERIIFLEIPGLIRNLEVRTKVGNIDIADISNDSIMLDTSTGNVIAHSLKTDTLTIDSSIGNIDLSEIKANTVEAKTSTGNIDITASADVLNAKSSIGDVSINADEINTMDISTGTGDIYISLEDENGTFSIETSNIVDAYIFGDNVGSRQDNLVYGTGRPIVKAKNSLGSIEIK